MKYAIYCCALVSALSLAACTGNDNTPTSNEAAPANANDAGATNGDTYGEGNGYDDNNMAPATDTGQYDNKETDNTRQQGLRTNKQSSNPANQSSGANGNDPDNENK